MTTKALVRTTPRAPLLLVAENPHAPATLELFSVSLSPSTRPESSCPIFLLVFSLLVNLSSLQFAALNCFPVTLSWSEHLIVMILNTGQSMRFKLLHFVSLLVFVTLTVRRSDSLSSNQLLGVSPEDLNFYKTSSEYVKCKDGSKKINRSKINDDFCDCPDGSDEPGTSACPNGKFYCQNSGHVPFVLFSSRVNDGICDCCDGSDEYDGKVSCSNTCWEAGKVARDKLKKKIDTYQKGIALRKKEIEKGKSALAKDEAELLRLKNEEKILKGLVQQLKERKEQIEKAEEKERLEAEKEEKARKEAEAKSNQEKTEAEVKLESGKDELVPSTDVGGELVHSTDDDHIGNIQDASDQDEEGGDRSKFEESSGYVDELEEQNHRDLAAASESGNEPKIEEPATSENTESLSKEELGRLVASRWTGDTGEGTGETDPMKDTEIPEELPKDLHDEQYEGSASEVDEDEERYDDHDVDDHMNDDLTDEDDTDPGSYKSDTGEESFLSSSSNPTWLEKIQNTVRNLLQAVNLFQVPVDKSDAARVRKEYDESSSKLSKIESRISTLSKKLKHDFGPEKEFYLFYDRCFESKQNKYVYKVCPFKQATQTEGHSSTKLGQWEKFGESYKMMLFSNGDKCWNGPDRSLKVKLRCGLENELTDVDEPSRCEYVALLSTPTICHEEKLKELQNKLDLLDKEQPGIHDEL